MMKLKFKNDEAYFRFPIELHRVKSSPQKPDGMHDPFQRQNEIQN